MTETKKVQCGQCGGVRNCDVLALHKETSSEEHYNSWKEWHLLKCRGCDFVFLLTESSDSESIDYDYAPDGSVEEEYEIRLAFYPALTKREPIWEKQQNYFLGRTYPELDSALWEVYEAAAHDLHVLTAIGIRTVFDVAAEILGVDASLSFAGKLDALLSLNTIVEADKERLETLINAGSASAHRGWKPNSDDVNTLMDMLEHFIDNAFVQPMKRKELDEKAKKMDASVPKRKKIPKKTTA